MVPVNETLKLFEVSNNAAVEILQLSDIDWSFKRVDIEVFRKIISGDYELPNSYMPSFSPYVVEIENGVIVKLVQCYIP